MTLLMQRMIVRPTLVCRRTIQSRRTAREHKSRRVASSHCCVLRLRKSTALVSRRDDESTVAQPQLVATQARKAAGAGGRAAEVTFSIKTRIAGDQKLSRVLERTKEITS